METGDLAATRGSCLPQNSGQQPVIVVVQAPPTNKQQCDEERYQKLLPKKTIMGMSVFMVVAGILSIIIQVAAIITGVTASYNQRVQFTEAFIGQGIWCGLFFVITGGLGFAVAKKPSKCKIIALMVFSILSAVMSYPHLYLDATAIAMSAGYWLDLTLVALFSINAIFALAAGIISIVISGYTCRAVCCPCGAGSTAVQQLPIQMTDLDLTKVIYTTQTSLNNECQEGAQQSQPPAYNIVNPVGNQHEDKEYADNSASDDQINGQYKRF